MKKSLGKRSMKVEQQCARDEIRTKNMCKACFIFCREPQIMEHVVYNKNLTRASSYLRLYVISLLMFFACLQP